MQQSTFAEMILMKSFRLTRQNSAMGQLLPSKRPGHLLPMAVQQEAQRKRGQEDMKEIAEAIMKLSIHI